MQVDHPKLGKGELGNLESAITFYDDVQTKCLRKSTVDGSKCSGTRKSTLAVKDVIFIELPTDADPPTANTQSDFETSRHISLFDLPSDITVKGKKYYLRAAIQHIAPLIGHGVGHYRTHCKSRGDHWFCFDDLRDNVEATKKPESRNFVIHIIVLSI